MIVRPDSDGLLLITQPDHAALAERVIAAWRRNGLPDAERRDAILLATREHDNGWLEPDAAPIIEPSTGRVLDFVSAPEDVRQAIWPRGVERLRDSPYAAALVAEHALTVYEHYRELPAWDPFFDRMQRARDEAAARAGHPPLADLRRDYFFVRMGDLISLAFCNGWREPQRLAEYELRLNGGSIRIEPDPFDGHDVALDVAARCLPRRTWTTPEEAAAAFDAADMLVVHGVIRGGGK